MEGWDGEAPVQVVQSAGYANNMFTNINSDGIQRFEVGFSDAVIRFREFFRNFRQAPNFTYIYRELLLRQFNCHENFIEVDLAHVNEYDQGLYNMLQTRPNDYIKLFEQGAGAALGIFLQNARDIPSIQVILKSSQVPLMIRELTAEHVNKLIKVPGIVIQSSQTRARATKYYFRCNTPNCDKVIEKEHNPAHGPLELPKCNLHPPLGSQ